MMTHTAKETGQQKEQWGVGVRGDREVGGGGGFRRCFCARYLLPIKKMLGALRVHNANLDPFFQP